MNYSLSNKLTLILAIGISILLSSASFFIDNSYWWDELYSTTVSLLSFNDMFNKYILVDVHPPLHLFLLKIWVSTFGSSEISTRMLSFIFSVGSLILISSWFIKNTSKYVAIPTMIFFSSSWLFIYYAQETRAYSMMLFFSTLTTLLYIEVINCNTFTNKKFYFLLVSSFILSLVHYFGLVFGGLILISLLFQIETIKNKTLITATGLISLIWPFIHFTYGSLGNKIGGDFWIASDGVQTTVTVFINSLLPQSRIIGKIITNDYFKDLVTMVLVITIVLLLVYIFKKYEKKLLDTKDYGFLKKISLIGIIFIIIIALLDLHSPISTGRNFIVILPLISIIFGLMMSSLKNQNKLFYLVLIFIIGSSLGVSMIKIESKITPMQNHKEAANYIVKKELDKTHDIYYGVKEKNDGFQNIIFKNTASYYLPVNTQLSSVDVDNITSLQTPFVYISQHRQINLKKIIEGFKIKGIEVNVFEPTQASKMSSWILYSK